MASADLIREARLRAGVTQAELARRAGRQQSSIARWERGAVTPSFETLQELIRACGLELTFRIASRDDSYVPHIERYLERTPAQRVAGALARARALDPLRDAAVRRG